MRGGLPGRMRNLRRRVGSCRLLGMRNRFSTRGGSGGESHRLNRFLLIDRDSVPFAEPFDNTLLTNIERANRRPDAGAPT